MKHVQIDKDVRTKTGLTLLTVRWYLTPRARKSGESTFKRLGLEITETDRSPDEHPYPYGFVAEHPKYREIIGRAGSLQS